MRNSRKKASVPLLDLPIKDKEIYWMSSSGQCCDNSGLSPLANLYLTISLNMFLNNVIYLAINLPASQSRRDNLKEQELRCGIRIQLVEAVSGADLTDEQKNMYNAAERSKIYTNHLTANEQACVHSYRKALSTFLASGAEYAVIMEDDVTLNDNFTEGVDFIINRLGGWQSCKLYTEASKMYDIMPAIEGAPLQPIFPRKFPWGAVCYLHSRQSAEILLENMKDFYLPADTLIAKILMSKGVPAFGTNPNLAGTLYPHNEQSDIDAGVSRENKEITSRTLFQYLRYRWSVFESTLGKMRMRRILKRSLYLKNAKDDK